MGSTRRLLDELDGVDLFDVAAEMETGPVAGGWSDMNRMGFARRLHGSAFYLFHAGERQRTTSRPELVRRRRDGRAQAMAAFAFARVPHYCRMAAERGLSAADIRGAADLARLPILEPEDVRRLGDDLLPEGTRKEDLIALETSGSSGIPRTIHRDVRGALLDLASLARERAVARARLGRPPSRRTAVISTPGGTSPAVATAIRKHLRLPGPARPDERVFSVVDDPDLVLAELVNFAPRVVYGFGSGVGELLRIAIERGLEMPAPELVVFTSDPIPAEERRLIEERLGSVVLGSYRATEALALGFQCGHGTTYHLNDDVCPVRVVDDSGRPLPAGEPGSVVLSNLVCRGTVLLNYRLGDRAALEEELCACGCPLPRLSLSVGRDYERIDLGGGRSIHYSAIVPAFDALPAWRWQVEPLGPARLLIRIVPREGADLAGEPERLRSRVLERTGARIDVEIECVPELDRDQGGKVPGLARPQRGDA